MFILNKSFNCKTTIYKLIVDNSLNNNSLITHIIKNKNKSIIDYKEVMFSKPPTKLQIEGKKW